MSEQEGDTIFALDRVSEEVLVDYFEREVAPIAPVLLVAEAWKMVDCCAGPLSLTSCGEYRRSNRRHARFDVPETQRLDTHGRGAQLVQTQP